MTTYDFTQYATEAAPAEVIAERMYYDVAQHDEVWNGAYMLAPILDLEHQDLVAALTGYFRYGSDWYEPGKYYCGVNVSDQYDNWTWNFRCPDVAVVLPDSKAVDRVDFYYGGPNFIAEIVTPDDPNDRSREKIGFYESTGVRELLIVDRASWKLELYSLQNNRLVCAGESDVTTGATIRSQVLPFEFRLIPGKSTPDIEAHCTKTGRVDRIEPLSNRR